MSIVARAAVQSALMEAQASLASEKSAEERYISRVQNCRDYQSKLIDKIDALRSSLEWLGGDVTSDEMREAGYPPF